MKNIFLFCVIFIVSGDCYNNLIASRDFEADPSGVCIFRESETDVADIKDVKIENEYDGDCSIVQIKEISTDYIPTVLKSVQPFKYFLVLDWDSANIREETFAGGDFENLYCAGITQPTIASYTFRKVKNLNKIEWTFSKLEKIAKHAFSGVENVTIIQLFENQISEIEPQAFNLATLTDLNLGRNKLKSIEDRTFEGAVNMRDLYLSENQIKTISENAFFGLENLRTLSLSANNIEILDPQIFKNTPHLRHLMLYDNQLSNLHESTFSLTKELETIDVGRNRINAISRKTFEDLANLNRLTLLENICVDNKYKKMPARDILNEDLRKCYENYLKTF